MSTYSHVRTIAILAFLYSCLFPGHSAAQALSMKNCLELTTKDHTSIVSSIQGKLASITALAKKENLDVIARSPRTSQSLLTTISKSRLLDSETSKKLELAATCILLMSTASIPERSQVAILKVAQELDRANSVPNAIERLNKLQKDNADPKDVQEALRVASSVLQDGQQRIYSEKEQVFQTLAARGREQPLTKAKSAGEHAVEVAAADGKGAVNGAVGGCVLGLLAGGAGCGPGALAGGIAGAIGNSAQELVEKGWKYMK